MFVFSRRLECIQIAAYMLPDDSTRSLTVFNSWDEFPELIPASKIIQAFQDKSKRLGKKKASQSDMDGDGRPIMVADDFDNDDIMVV